MISEKRLFGFLATGTIPESNALDAAIERFEASKKSKNGISDELMDEMLEFLRGGSIRDDAATAMDEETTLAEHDKRFHPDGFDSRKETCGRRDKESKGDPDDDLSAAASPGNGRLSKVDDPIPGLSNKKRREYETLMKKKHPNIDSMKLLTELGKIGDRKVQGDAFRWVMKGAARLPEDLYKVEQSREMADKAKVDPLQYNTPQACIDALKGKVTLKEKPIDPDSVPELSDKKVLPMGVTTYLVQDDRAGQKAMRKIIDTHWGKDANPWCLLARSKGAEEPTKEELREGFRKWWDGLTEDEKDEFQGFPEDDDYGEPGVSGRFSEPEDEAYDYYVLEVHKPSNDGLASAMEYWRQYSGLPKRVAFKDGELLAFMATEQYDEDLDPSSIPIYAEEYNVYCNKKDEEGEYPDDFYYWMLDNYPDDLMPKEQWWDRQDKDHEGIPVGNMPVPNDEYGRWANYEIVNGEVVRSSTFLKGSYGTPGYKEWYDNGKIKVQNLPNGRSNLYDEEGLPVSLWSTELGGSIRYYPDGNVKEICDGRHAFATAGLMLSDDGRILQWNDTNGYGLPYGQAREVGRPDRNVLQAMLDYIPKAKEMWQKHRQ